MLPSHDDGAGAPDDVAVLVWAGEIDVATIPALRSDARRQLAAVPAQIVIDLAGVTFLDSMAVGLLLETRADADAAGIPLFLRAMPARVLSLLRSCGVLRLFDYDEADGAAVRLPGLNKARPS